LQRDRMRQLVHSEPSARQRLEAIIHPLVGQETARQAARFAERMCPCIVFDIPLLVESAHWRLNLDHVLVLDCTAEEQISRVMVRNQLSQSEVEKIISSQASRRLRLAAADSVIFNVGLSLAELEADLRQISPRFGLSSG
jgi:dephospho-CoA kinase